MTQLLLITNVLFTDYISSLYFSYSRIYLYISTIKYIIFSLLITTSNVSSIPQPFSNNSSSLPFPASNLYISPSILHTLYNPLKSSTSSPISSTSYSSSTTSSNNSPSTTLLSISPYSSYSIYSTTPYTTTTTKQYPSSISKILKNKIKREDFEFDVKIIPPDTKFSIFLRAGEVKRVMFPISFGTSLSMILAPCTPTVSWTLSLRPLEHPPEISKHNSSINSITEVQPDSETSKQKESTKKHSLYNIVDAFRPKNSPVYDYLKSYYARKRYKKLNKTFYQMINNTQKYNKKPPNLYQTEYAVFSKNSNSNKYKQLNSLFKSNYSIIKTDGTLTNKYKPRNQHQADEKYDNILNNNKLDKDNYISYNMKHFQDELMSDEYNDMIHRIHLNLYDPFKGEFIIGKYSGSKAWVLQEESAPPGLYVLQVHSIEDSFVHLEASRDMKDWVKNDEISTKKSPKGGSVIISWPQRASETGGRYCLAVSRRRYYNSLCEARGSHHNKYNQNSKHIDETLILGCTASQSYVLPVFPQIKYFVSVWAPGSLFPLGYTTIKNRSHHQIPRLRSGQLLQLSLVAGGEATVKFRNKRPGKRLHVVVVSCAGGVRVKVKSKRQRVAEAAGKEALHLRIRRIPKGIIRITLSHDPPSTSLYRVLVAAAHSARRLPIPRLPDNVQVKSRSINCTSGMSSWHTAPGGSTYCIIMKLIQNRASIKLDSPIQCGWDQQLRRPQHNESVRCLKGIKGRIQRETYHNLSPNTTYSVTVLVRHPKTYHTLALTQSLLSTPLCAP